MNASTSAVGKLIATRLSNVLYPLKIQLMGGLPVWLLFCVLVPGHGRVVLLVLPAGCLADGCRHISLKFTLTARGAKGWGGSILRAITAHDSAPSFSFITAVQHLRWGAVSRWREIQRDPFSPRTRRFHTIPFPPGTRRFRTIRVSECRLCAK
jgi:hypothetical protein